MSRIIDFLEVFLLYRKNHSMAYAARIAWGCTFGQLPF